MQSIRLYRLFFVSIMCATVALAQDPLKDHTNTVVEMQRLFEAERGAYAGNTNVLVLPGVRANRTNREVVVWAKATGISQHDIAEFFIIAPQSGNDYEALFIALATAQDIDQGLRFIGLTPGRPVDYECYRFWPKGERVMAWVRRPDHNKGDIPLESLLINTKTGNPLPVDGLVYVEASRDWIDSQGMTNRHPVDVDTRGSIAANYNEPITLFDVPRAAPQSDFYSSQTVNPAYTLTPGERVMIILRPECSSGESRIRDVDIQVDTSNSTTQSLASLTFSLTTHPGNSTVSNIGLNDFLQQVAMMRKNRQDPFIRLHIDDQVQVDALKALCLVLASIETDAGIRMEPPDKGELYYKAYIPDDALRNRDERIMQPVELSINRATNGTYSASLLDINEHWLEGESKPQLTFRPHAIASPADLQTTLKATDDDLPILLVFVDPTLTHGELMRWLRPVLSTHPTVHVFTSPPDPTS